MSCNLTRNGKAVTVKPSITNREKYVASTYRTEINPGDELIMFKYVSVLSSLNNEKDALMSDVKKRLGEAAAMGFDKLFADQDHFFQRGCLL